MKTLTIFLVILVWEVVCADQKPDPVISRGIEVEAFIKQKYQLPFTGEVVTLRDVSVLNLKSLFDSLGYQLGLDTDVFERPGKFTIRQMEWEGVKKTHDEQVRVILVVGQNGWKDALTGLFEIMGGTSMRITSSDYEVLPAGPGNVCFVMPMNVDRKDNDVKVQRKIWFCKDNIGIEVSCSASKNLLPIARAIERAISSCKQVGKPSETTK